VLNIHTFIPELGSLPLFRGVSQEQISKLCESATIQVTRHREALFHAGDRALSFGIVLGGAFKLTRRSPMGEDVIMHFVTAGDIVAALVMPMPSSTYPVSAISIGPSRFLKIPRDNYIQTWSQHHEILFRIQSLVATRMRNLHDQKVLSRAPLTQKVAALLLNLFEKRNGEKETSLPIPLTRKEIADSLGSSVESVIRVMSEWSKAGMIQTTDRYIQVLCPEKIVEILKQSNI
jgi:CRP-like cAMP-binding protein